MASSQKQRLRLIRQLRDARDLLQTWDASLRAVAVQTANPDEPRADERQPSEIAVLLAIVDEAKQGLEQRLAELDADAVLSSTGAKSKQLDLKKSARKEVSSLSLCVKACRACGRALGAAFREAQLIADAASVRVLYNAIRDFEKQLWVLDPRQAY
jgi:hypothetical protein